jgi:sugar lactone lactonase YvrE
MTCEIVLEAQDIVGESAVWDDRNGCLVWVDIIRRRVQALSPGTGAHRVWKMPDRVTSIGLRQDGGAILGLERHLALWDWTGAPHLLCEVEPDMPDNRLNEGVVGPDGAFWVGTMQNNIAADDSARPITDRTGRIYRLDATGGLRPVSADRFGITNTFVWPDAGHFVTADTLEDAVYRYPMDPATGSLGPRETILQGFGRGLPDGSCLDAEGMIWTARVAGGACLTRTSPEGDLLTVIDLPCSWPTSCAFGGAGLDTLYVTSARFTMASEHLKLNPQEGGLFAVRPGVTGHPPHRFGPVGPDATGPGAGAM